MDVAVGAQPADRAQRRFDQLAELAGLLVEDEALHLEARDLQHLLQQTVEPLRLPLEDLDRPWIGGLALLDPAGERIRESLDAGERGLQLVRGEAQEAVLARLALGGGEHRARAAQQGLERLQRDRSLGREAQHQGAHGRAAHPERDAHRASGALAAPLRRAGLQGARGQVRGGHPAVLPEQHGSARAAPEDRRRFGARQLPRDARDARGQLSGGLARQRGVGELRGGSRGVPGQLQASQPERPADGGGTPHLAQKAADDERAVAKEGEHAPDPRLAQPEPHCSRPGWTGGEDEGRPSAAADGVEQPASPRNVAQVHRLRPGGPISRTPLNLGRAEGLGEWEKCRESVWDDAARRLQPRGM